MRVDIVQAAQAVPGKGNIGDAQVVQGELPGAAAVDRQEAKVREPKFASLRAVSLEEAGNHGDLGAGEVLAEHFARNLASLPEP